MGMHSFAVAGSAAATGSNNQNQGRSRKRMRLPVLDQIFSVHSLVPHQMPTWRYVLLLSFLPSIDRSLHLVQQPCPFWNDTMHLLE